MKLAIIGSRDFDDYKLLKETLEPYKSKITLVVSGGARGADTLGENWANFNNIKTQIFYPDWKNNKKAAPFIRNEEIIKNCDCCIAFWNEKSHGTRHALKLCDKFDKPYKIISF